MAFSALPLSTNIVVVELPVLLVLSLPAHSMHPKYERFFLIFVIALGAVLRIVDIAVPDFATDEAQFALGASAAQPPLGMFLLQIPQFFFPHEIIPIRAVSVLLGLLTLPLIFGITKTFSEEKTALLTAAVAAIFPSHIFFSRLAYLSIPLCFGWALLLFTFLKARRAKTYQSAVPWIIAVFLASVFVTHIKTQGLLLPLLLLTGTLIERRKQKNNSQFSIFNYQLSLTLFLSLLPISFYILTHPGIAATLFLYSGSMYGVSNILTRVLELVTTWWSILGIFLLAIFFGLQSLRECPWPVNALIVIGLLIGLLLGPGHSYYTTKLVFLSIPIAISLSLLTVNARTICMIFLLLFTLFTLGPTRLVPFPHEIFTENGFWNQNAPEFNEFLRSEKSVVVLGDAGHQVRWYLEPEILAGKNMPPPYETKYVLLLGQEELGKVAGSKVVLAGEMAAIVQIRD